ncbi:hypothetical protein ACS3QZ_02140 [Shimia sp. W99]
MIFLVWSFLREGFKTNPSGSVAQNWRPVWVPMVLGAIAGFIVHVALLVVKAPQSDLSQFPPQIATAIIGVGFHYFLTRRMKRPFFVSLGVLSATGIFAMMLSSIPSQ